jgi:hypothetical protein
MLGFIVLILKLSSSVYNKAHTMNFFFILCIFLCMLNEKYRVGQGKRPKAV